LICMKITESNLQRPKSEFSDPEKLKRFRSAVVCIKKHKLDAEKKRITRFRAAFDLARMRIRNRALEEFRQHEWPRFQMLDDIFKKGLGLPVPVLSVCGEGTAEVRYTKLLAYFLDSRNRHGLGGLLSRAVFSDMIDCGHTLPFDACTAQSEVFIGETTIGGKSVQNNLDILIDVGGHKILIEQKINSAEGEYQLTRYSEAIRKTAKDVPLHCFFLTPDGRDGQEDEWTPLSYSVMISRMCSVLECHALSGPARHNLRSLLWDLLLGPLAQDKVWMDELQKLTGIVAKDYTKYTELKRWFNRYGLEAATIRVVAKLIGD
jgi:hypothetical protein